jgi:hypothetical protein
VGHRVEGGLGRYREHIVIERSGLDRLACDTGEACNPVVDKVLTTSFEPGVGAPEADVWLLAVNYRESRDRSHATRERHTVEQAKARHRQVTV